MLSFYGAYLHKQRYGGNSDKYTKELLASQWLSEEELRKLQKKKLNELISHAYEHVPYYNEIFKVEDLTPEDIADGSDLRKVPVLTKDTIKNSFDKLIMKDSHGKRLAKFHTSGTTGSPMTVVCDLEDRRRHYAFLNRFRSWHGTEVGLRRASFFGRIIVSPDQTEPPFWRYDFAEKNYHFSSYHMSERNLLYYYQKLKKLRPVEICGYPSSLFVIAKYIVSKKLPALKPRFIMTTAETLMVHQRQMIEKAFDCKISDQYGCTEMALFVSQCEKGSYHVNPEYGIVEVLDSNGSPAKPGEAGEAVCTSFINTVMPLIRYKLGDRIKMASTPCGCGRNFPVIEQIEGRVDDILITPDGKPLGRLDPIFKSLTGIYETQIIQTSKDAIELKIVTGDNFTVADMDELVCEIKKRTGPTMKIRINKVNEIPKDKNGKFRAVISRIINKTNL